MSSLRHALAAVHLLVVASLAGCNPSTPDRNGESGPPVDAQDTAVGTREAPTRPQPEPPAAPVAIEVPDDLPFGQNHPAFFAGIEGDGPLVATISTSMGDIRCELFERETPDTVANFVGLARGKKAFVDPATGDKVVRPFYDGVEFHRVIPGFMIQTGDPTGTGTYNPGYGFADEIGDDLRHDRGGRLSMANTGEARSNGTQFFITESATPHLDGKHTIFGQCADLDAIKMIARVPSGPGDRPLQAVAIGTISFRRGERPPMTFE
jgi:cyclophilin family peptidyl-prolyl cis-trans isomerase